MPLMSQIDGSVEVTNTRHIPEALMSMTPLGAGATWDSGIVDLEADGSYEFLTLELATDQTGTFIGYWYDDLAGTNEIRTFTIPYTNIGVLFTSTAKVLGRYVRATYVNGATPQSFFSVRLREDNVGSAGQLVQVEDFIPSNIQAQVTRSIVVAKDPSNVYQNIGCNQFGAINSSDFLLEVIQGRYPEIRYDTKFGRNADIDTGSAPEDIWHGGGLYTGHSATANENLDTRSSSSNDTGALISSGTITSITGTVVIDSSATFITDGVVAGDTFMSDTSGSHGYVQSIDSETQITIYAWQDGTVSNGDSYRIGRATGTGAGIVKWSRVLDVNYEIQPNVYVILDGLNSVISTGNFFRLSRGRVLAAGSSQYNIGTIIARQEVTTANVFAVMPETASRTAICCDTVPAGKTRIIINLYSAMARVNGSAGSANTRFQKRVQGGAWETLRNCEITDGVVYDPEGVKGIVLAEKTDCKWRCESVSDNNTIVTGEFKYVDIDNV